jgi:RNA polymerase sigma-70 factor (ECF subfamily)
LPALELLDTTKEEGGEKMAEITLLCTDSVREEPQEQVLLVPTADNTELAEMYKRHVKTVYRVCFTYMKNETDTEDAVADTFVKMLASRKQFDNAEHEKAWLIRAAINVCKDNLKHWWRKRESLSDHSEALGAADGGGKAEILETVLETVLALPEKYKSVVYLYYYEGYNSAEIAAFLKKPQSTVRNHLHEARKQLKERLGDYYD